MFHQRKHTESASRSEAYVVTLEGNKSTELETPCEKGRSLPPLMWEQTALARHVRVSQSAVRGWDELEKGSHDGRLAR